MLDDVVVQWCSICNKKPSEGIAVVQESDDTLIDLPMCLDCLKKIAPPSQHYSLGI